MGLPCMALESAFLGVSSRFPCGPHRRPLFPGRLLPGPCMVAVMLDSRISAVSSCCRPSASARCSRIHVAMSGSSSHRAGVTQLALLRAHMMS